LLSCDILRWLADLGRLGCAGVALPEVVGRPVPVPAPPSSTNGPASLRGVIGPSVPEPLTKGPSERVRADVRGGIARGGVGVKEFGIEEGIGSASAKRSTK